MDKEVVSSKKAIIWLSSAHFVCDIYSGFLNPIMPFIAAKLEISLALATVIISVSHICSSMMQPIFGFFADNMYKRLFIFWGLILTSLFIPLTPLAPNIFFLLCFMVLGSLGGSFFHPQSMGFVNYFSNNNCSSNMGIFISLGSLGFALGPLFAALITQIVGLDLISYTSILGLVLAVSMFNFVPKLSKINKVVERKSFIKSFNEILGNIEMRYLMLISMMKSMVTNSSCILLPFLWKDMGKSPFYIGFSLFLFVFGGAIGSFLSPIFEKKYGSKSVIYFSMLSTFPLMIIFAMTYKTMPVVSTFVFFLMGVSTMLAQPVTMVWAQRVLPKYKSIVAGFINGFCWGIVALCMSMFGLLAQQFGIIKILVCLSILPAISSYYLKYLKSE